MIANHPKILTSESLSWFEKFLYGFIILTWWEDGTYCLFFVLYGHKNGRSEILRKTISNMADSS